MANIVEILKKNKGSAWLLVALTAGILLFLVGSFESSNETATVTDDKEKEYASADTYVATLERRVSELLNRMDGISEVSVIITADSCAEIIYAQNGKYQDGYLTEKEYVLSDGEEPIRVKLVYPKLRGIAVVCRGGANPVNQEKIMKLLSSLFDLPSNKVYVTG